jgi:hypothetical protein
MNDHNEFWYTTAGGGTKVPPRVGKVGSEPDPVASPRVDRIDDGAGNAVLDVVPVAAAVNYLTVSNAATGGWPTITAAGQDADISLNLVSKGGGFLRENGRRVVTDNNTVTLSNKTISGRSNSLREATWRCDTAVGGEIVENGANTWAKLLTLDCGNLTNRDINLVLAVVGAYMVNTPEAALISVFARSSAAAGTAPYLSVEILSKTGSTVFLRPDSFKLVNKGFGLPVELWVKKYWENGQFVVSELARGERPSSWTVTYNASAPWQAAEPTGSNTVTSKPVGGLPADRTITAFAGNTVRAVGLGDNPFGVKLGRAVTATAVTYRCATASASGNLVVELRKNGAAIPGTSATIPAATQVAGATVTGNWVFAAGDVVTVNVTAVGTTPGNGLVADITATT